SVATLQVVASKQAPVCAPAPAESNNTATPTNALSTSVPLICPAFLSPRYISLSRNHDLVDHVAPGPRLEEAALRLQIPRGVGVSTGVVRVRFLRHAENAAAGRDWRQPRLRRQGTENRGAYAGETAEWGIQPAIDGDAAGEVIFELVRD